VLRPQAACRASVLRSDCEPAAIRPAAGHCGLVHGQGPRAWVLDCCQRLLQVDFSTVYFDAAQRILVQRDSPVRNLSGLVGEKACATTGSTSLALLKAQGNIVTVAVPYWTDCLVLLQQGDVAAISTDDSILAGLQAQDPVTKIVGRSLSTEPYGLAISKQHPDFVRFVNAVLARMRADGQWAASYRRRVGTPVPAPPSAHYLS
jgi:polar amino acid transport system substrate-binding protein